MRVSDLCQRFLPLALKKLALRPALSEAKGVLLERIDRVEGELARAEGSQTGGQLATGLVRRSFLVRARELAAVVAVKAVLRLDIAIAQGVDDMDARAMALRREVVETYLSDAALQEFDHPSQGLRLAGMDYRDVFVQAFQVAFLNLTVGPDGYKPPSPPKKPSAAFLGLLMAVPGGEQMLVLRQRAAQLKMLTESEDNIDRRAKGGLATAKSLVGIFNGAQAALAFDGLTPIQKTAVIFETAGKILDGQKLPAPFIVYLCDVKASSQRGGQAIALVTRAFGNQDHRATDWDTLNTSDKYHAVQDALKKIFADGTAALKGSVEDADNYLEHFKEPGQVVPPDDQLVMMAFGKEARARYQQLGAGHPESIEMRKAAVALHTGWAYMCWTLVGEQQTWRPTNETGEVAGVKKDEAASKKSTPAAPTDQEIASIRESLKKYKGAFESLTQSTLQVLVKALRAAEQEFEDVKLTPAFRDLRIYAPVRGAWAESLEFTPSDVFGPKEGEGLDDKEKAVLTEKYKKLVVQTVQLGGSMDAAKKMGRAMVQFELKGGARSMQLPHR